MKFFKSFGLGLLYAILSPLLLALLAIIAVIGLFNFLIQFIIMLVRFFQGKKLFAPFPEDEKAYKILVNIQQAELNPNGTSPAPAPQNVYVQQNYYSSPAPGGAPLPGANPNGLPQGNWQGVPNPNQINPQQAAPSPLPQNSQPVNQIPVDNQSPQPAVIDIPSEPEHPALSHNEGIIPNDGGDENE